MKQLMLGNQAIARGAYEAGFRVVSSYPGTPSTEITEYISKYPEIYSEWAPNEKVAAEVALGAAIAGSRSLTAMKHVGLNVAADPLFTASYTGVNGALVVVVADDPGMHSSQNEQDSRHYAKAAKLPMLEPSDSAECREYIIRAAELSEKFDTPIIVRLSTRVAHSQSLVQVSERQDIPLKPYTKDAQKYVMMPAMARKRHIIVEERMRAMVQLAETTPLNTVEYGDGEIGVISSGIAYQFAKEALPNASFLKLGMVHPLPEKLLKEFASKVKKLYVIEELDPIIEEHCKAIGLNVIGKEAFTLQGEYSTEMLRKAILNQETNIINIEENIPVRPPVLCPGCPHRAVYQVLNKLNLAVSGDIGCYTLGAMPPLGAMDVCVCMGASISGMHGMEKSRGREFSGKAVAIIGDSTFMHSGITGLVDIVYNKGNSTVIILDNSITGMTGHQQNPTTGYTIKNEPTKAVNLEMLCKAVGVDDVVVADPFDLTGFESIVKAALANDAPSVIIARRPCALLKCVDYGAPYAINQDACTGCRLCMRLGCPSITFTDGKAKINQALCIGCGLCSKVCKFGAIAKVGEGA